MPDENVTSIGTNQKSQDDQVATVQTGDDFVLDFGDGEENTQSENAEVEMDGLDVKQPGTEEVALNSMGNDFDAGDFFGEKEEVKEGEGGQNIENQNEEKEDKNVDNDFEISLDENVEEKELTSGDLEKNEEVNSENFNDEGEESGGDDFSEKGENDSVKGVLEHDGNGEDEKIEQVDFEGDEKTVDEEVHDDEDLGEQSEENYSDSTNDNLNDDVGSEVNIDFSEESADESKVQDFSLDSEEFTENNEIENKGLNEIEDNGEKDLDKEEKLDFNGGESVEGVDNKQDIASFEEESVSGVSTVDGDTQEPLNQPEIGDLLGNGPVDFSEEQGGSVNEMANNSSLELNQQAVVLQDDENHVQENNLYESSQNEQIENNMDNDVENQSFTLDYKDDSENESNQEVTAELDETIGGVNSQEVQNSNENVVMNSDINQEESESQPVTSTLSLDQILDTELKNNPQYADNSKAVPVNVSTSKGLIGNKKMVGVIAGIGLFLMAGLVVVLAFPSIGSNMNSGSISNTEQVLEENEDNHPVAEFTEDEEGGNLDEMDLEDLLEEDGGEIVSHVNKVTVEQDFPEVEWEEEQNGEGEPEPYVCDGDNCTGRYGGSSSNVENLEVKDIQEIISDIKSKAEQYYAVGDDMQDKKLVRYALQTISLCDNYQRQIEDGEGLNDVDFSSFKTKGELLLNKMEKYLIGEDYTASVHNVDGEDNFNEREELRDYIYERNSY